MVAPTSTGIVLVLVSILLTYSIAIPVRMGAFSLAPAALSGVAAYTSAILTTKQGYPLPTSLVCGVLAAVVVAAVFAVPLSRVRGIYTALMTVSLIVVATSLEDSLSITGGSLGTTVPYSGLRLALVIAVIIVAFAYRMADHSSLGRWLSAVQADQDLARALGIRITWLRFGVFSVSGLIAGFAGAAYAHGLYFISPANFSFDFAITLAIYVIVSGAEHWLTPLIGAALLTLFTVCTPGLGNWSTVIEGGTAAVITVLYPRGLGGVVRQHLRYRFSQRRAARLTAVGTAARQLAGGGDRSAPARLRVEGVLKAYGGVVALDDVSFAAEGPGCLGVIGANGSGKSTLIGVLSGLIRPEAGRVTVARGDGEHTGDLRVARCFQQPKLVPNLRVWENIALGGADARSRRRSTALRFGALAGLTSAELNTWPSDISTGNQRKAELARALISDPHVLLLDEPAAGLSGEELESFVSVLREAIRSRLVIIVEHNLRLVYALADEVILLSEGRLVQRGTPRQMRESPVVAEAYLGTSATADETGSDDRDTSDEKGISDDHGIKGTKLRQTPTSTLAQE